jgi:hypothetical protein
MNLAQHMMRFHAAFVSMDGAVCSNPNYRESHKDCDCANCGAPDQDERCRYCGNVIGQSQAPIDHRP